MLPAFTIHTVLPGAVSGCSFQFMSTRVTFISVTAIPVTAIPVTAIPVTAIPVTAIPVTATTCSTR